MGGTRIESYWADEMKSVLYKYHQFEKLIPSLNHEGAGHRGEDGRYVESILRETLKKFLPTGIEIFDGFILRAGVKGGNSGRARRKDADVHSSQLDLIIYDAAEYPVYQRFGDTAVVLPEGVLAVISVKKNLYLNEVNHELQMLKQAGQICAFHGKKGPFLALVGMGDKISDEAEKSFKKVAEKLQAAELHGYEEMPGFIGALEGWTIHRRHRKDQKEAEYQLFVHEEGEEHLGLQYLLKGILDVYYSEDRKHGCQPGFISFPKGKQYCGETCRLPYRTITAR